jgi:hypothetical protein
VWVTTHSTVVRTYEKEGRLSEFWRTLKITILMDDTILLRNVRSFRLGGVKFLQRNHSVSSSPKRSLLLSNVSANATTLHGQKCKQQAHVHTTK